jgi:HK97 family phage portal protein
MKILKLFKKNLDKYALFRSIDLYEDKHKTAHDFLRLNEMSLYTNKAIEKRADKVSEINFVMQDQRGERVEHEILDILNNPNEYHTGSQFWALVQKYFDLTGNAYIYIERERELFENSKITKLYPLRPDLTKREFNPDGTIKQYVYQREDKQITYQPEQVLHIFRPDPLNPINGISLLKAGVRAIDTEIQLSEYHAKIIANGGKPEGMFKVNDPTLNPEKLRELKAAYEEQYAGAKKSGKPLFMGGDIEYVSTGLTPDELGHLEGKRLTLNDICILTGVPREILGSVGEATFANAQAAQDIFLRETIKPIMENLVNILNWKLVPDNLELSFIDPTPENVKEKMEAIKLAHDINCITINEKRQLLAQIIEGFEFEEVDNGDEVMIPFNQVPVQQRGLKKKQLNPLSDFNTRRIHEANKIKSMESEEKVFIRAIKKIFNEQRDEIIERIDATKHFRKKSLLDEVFNKGREVERIRLSAPPVLREIMIRAGAEAVDFAGGNTFTPTSAMESWISQRVDTFSQQVVETSFKELEGVFVESIALGENRRELIERIRETYTDWDTTRAETIARTEVHSAFQKATVDGYEQAGMTLKIWTTSFVNSRDSHIAMDGEERPMNMPFSNGLMFPGDSGPPEEVINCQCTV